MNVVIASISHFNSTIVRLKVDNGYLFNRGLSKFQFNYCTIKRKRAGAVVAAVDLDFNSTIVRLKAPLPTTKNTTSNDFNSTIVRLKEKTGIANVESFRYFNSTIVRLKVKV